MASTSNHLSDSAEAEAMLNVFDGRGNPFEGQILLRIHNERDANVSKERRGPSVFIKIPFHNGPGDFYAVCVSSPGHRDSGCFFKADPTVLAEPKIILLPNKPEPRFAPWSEFKGAHPAACAFFSEGIGEQSAQTHYEELSKINPDSLACLLNLTQAMGEIELDGRTPLSYFKKICWDTTMAQDRFFGYVDPSIIPAVRAATEKGNFAEEMDCARYHPGATHSWKQIAFLVTNVQLTFYEHDTALIDGTNCIKIEPDIDLYRELLAHGFGEVFPNLLTGNRTNPYAVFSMRWTIANDENGPGFDPGYEIA